MRKTRICCHEDHETSEEREMLTWNLNQEKEARDKGGLMAEQKEKTECELS